MQKTGLVSLFDVETCKRLRSWRGTPSALTNCNVVSYCRSVVAPYLVAVGEGSSVGLYDVRTSDPAVLKITGHTGDICSLSWSINQSSDLMRQSSQDNVYLATGCTMGTLGVWSLKEMIRAGSNSVLTPEASNLWEPSCHDSYVQSIAWHPRQEGLLATGAPEPDKLIKIWDLNSERVLEYIMRCQNGISSMSWHDFSSSNTTNLGSKSHQTSELVSSHFNESNKLTLWQVDDVNFLSNLKNVNKY